MCKTLVYIKLHKLILTLLQTCLNFASLFSFFGFLGDGTLLSLLSGISPTFLFKLFISLREVESVRGEKDRKRKREIKERRRDKRYREERDKGEYIIEAEMRDKREIIGE